MIGAGPPLAPRFPLPLSQSYLTEVDIEVQRRLQDPSSESKSPRASHQERDCADPGSWQERDRGAADWSKVPRSCPIGGEGVTARAPGCEPREARVVWRFLPVVPVPVPGPVPGVGLLILGLPAAMVLELYLDLMSQPCRAVYIFAKKNGIPFELRTVELSKGQHHSDAFAQVNPLRKVPALKDGDFTLAESVAILLYLCRKYETPDHWYPQDLQARARVDEYLAWQHTALRSSCTRAMWQKMMIPVFLGERVPPETLASTLAELDRCLQLLEDKFLKDKDFLAGPHISVADLMAITELMHPVSAGCHIFKSRPKLAAWRQRVEAAVGEDLFQEAHEVVMKAKDLPPADTAVKEKLKPLVQVLLQ